MEKKTTIINLYGGPGTGKSTSAAYLYYLLKIKDINAELVREYVKNWAWEGRKVSINDQIYLLGKQVRNESLLYGKVDWIVTDSPVMMNLYYAETFCTAHIAAGLRELAIAFYKQAELDGHKHVHVFLKRTKPYLAEGRYQTEDEAKNIDGALKVLLDKLGIPYLESDVDAAALASLLQQLLN